MAMTVGELSEQVRDSNERLTEAIHNLRRELTESRQKVRQELGELRSEFVQSCQKFSGSRVEVAKTLGAVNANLEALRSSFKVEVAEKLGAINTNLETLKTRVENSLSIAKWAMTVIVPVVLGVIVWSYSAHERLARIEGSILSLRDTAQAHTNQIEDLVKIVRAKPPALDASGIRELTDQIRGLREELKKSKNTNRN